MNKKERVLQRINDLEKELIQLKEEVKLFDENVELKITNIYKEYYHTNCVDINSQWAFSYFNKEREGEKLDGRKISGHKAILYLADCNGEWYDGYGNKISGYLFYKPNKE